MEPVIHNVKKLPVREGDGVRRVRLIGLDDQPPTCTMGYTELEPGKTGSHHIHPWEHERYILSGSGVLFCDGKEYAFREGDAIFIPGNVDHYALNNGGQGLYRHLEINPLMAAQSGGAGNNGGKGTGQPPVIVNYRDLNPQTGSRLLSTKDGVPNYVMLYNGEMAPGMVSHPDTNGHTHSWEHLVFVLEGDGTLVCDGETYQISEGDAVLVPPNAHHQWRNSSQLPLKRLTINPNAAEVHGG